ncbi:MAG: hypothetical protein NZM44_06440, partial [Candidatus Calescibacterium sp.]|nr:hypothetical protein [Candidatus Calescibacterium sp.]
DDGTIYYEKSVEMDSWLTMFGICIVHCQIISTHNGIVRVTLENMMSKELMLFVLEKLNYNYKLYHNTIEIIERHLYLYLKNLKQIKSQETKSQESFEYLPEWVWRLSSRQARILLKSMILEEGVQNESCLEYVTTSSKIVDWIMQLSLHCGWYCDMNIENSTRSDNNKWKLIITTKSKSYSEVRKGNSIEEIIHNYSKPVFCIEIPDRLGGPGDSNGPNGIFYVRRNGKPVWTGNSRARGPTQLLTRQPPEGRSRDGGLRAGEMERDAMAAHGIAQFLKERMVDNSDIYTAYVCDYCGLFAHRFPGKKYYICRSCKNTTRISKIVIPYAFKLFIQELRSINILGRIRTSRSITLPKN